MFLLVWWGVGVILGSLFALIFQKNIVVEVSGMNDITWISLFSGTMKSLYGSITIETSNQIVNELLSSSGMFGMLNTIWLVISAMIFGGVMETAGFLKKISSIILDKINILYSYDSIFRLFAAPSTKLILSVSCIKKSLIVSVIWLLFKASFLSFKIFPSNA